MFTIGCEAAWGGVTRPSQAGVLYLGTKYRMGRLAGWLAGYLSCLSIWVYPRGQYLTMWLPASSAGRGGDPTTCCTLVTTRVVRWLVSRSVLQSPSFCSSRRSLGGTSTKTTSGCSWGLVLEVARACFDSALAKAGRDTTSFFGGRDCRTAIRRFQLSSLDSLFQEEARQELAGAMARSARSPLPRPGIVRTLHIYASRVDTKQQISTQ